MIKNILNSRNFKSFFTLKINIRNIKTPDISAYELLLPENGNLDYVLCRNIMYLK